jgi:hypothetical protein
LATSRISKLLKFGALDLGSQPIKENSFDLFIAYVVSLTDLINLRKLLRVGGRAILICTHQILVKSLNDAEFSVIDLQYKITAESYVVVATAVYNHRTGISRLATDYQRRPLNFVGFSWRSSCRKEAGVHNGFGIDEVPYI